MNPRPTAVFVTDPIIGVGLINEARTLGVDIPGELSVVGVDDDDARSMTSPSMSSVCQDSEAIGRSAVTLLRQMIDGAITEPVALCIDAWFDVRGTTAPPARSSARAEVPNIEPPAVSPEQI
jgi:DNA-binding LacI/PurR family transcriptional regulator